MASGDKYITTHRHTEPEPEIRWGLVAAVLLAGLGLLGGALWLLLR